MMRRLPVDAAAGSAYGPLEAPRDTSDSLHGSGQDRRIGVSEMTYGVVHHFKGATKQQYEASIAAVHPADGSLPAGQLFHAAGPSPEGWTIVAIHDSQASWETFRDKTLMPRMQQGIEGGFTSPPEETGFEVVNEVRA
jgi:hypothetical protein